jgi:hypothetical protein
LRGIIGMALAIALAASIAAPVLADTTTGNISGTVTTTTGAPVANLDVVAVAPSGRFTTKTDAKGFFSIVGVNPDTYSVTFSGNGYSPATVNGVTVNPTQTTTVNQQVSAQLKTIGSTTSRATGVSAFQPQQPVDTYSVNSNQITTLLGKPHGTSETNLLISLPGASLDKSGYPVLRGGRENDEGFQFEGIDYTDAFTNQFVNNLRLNGVGNFQLTPGAGDPSLGNTGTGAINATVKRGSYPHFGSAEVDVGGPLYQHFGTAEYGFATPDGRFSSYNTYNAENNGNTTCGRSGIDINTIGCQQAYNYYVNRDLISNNVFKFGGNSRNGNNNNQSLQLFYQNSLARFSAINNFGRNTFRVGDPVFDANYIPNLIGPNTAANRQIFAGITALEPGQTAFCVDFTTNCAIAQMLNRPPNTQIQPNETMKIQYSNALNSSTFVTAKLYKVNATAIFDEPDAAPAALSFGNVGDADVIQGGQRTGFALDFTKQLGTKHLLGFGGKYEFIHPIDSYLSATIGDIAACCGSSDFAFGDFVPASAGGTGYLATYFPGGVPRVPLYDQNPTINRKDFAFYLSDQFQASDKLKITGGLRVDGTRMNYPNLHDGAYNVPGGYSSGSYFPIGTGVDSLGNPDPTKDIYADISQYPTLSVLEPRFGFAYQFTPRDSLTFSYGRSTELPPISFVDNHFPTAPFAAFKGIPSTTPVCGPTGDRVCRDYADQLYWDYQNTDGIPYTPAKAETFSNFDASLQHDFGRGIAAKLTPFYRRGYDVLVQTATQKLINGAPAFDANGNPILNPNVTSNAGINRTTGVEFYLTKTAAFGLSGSLSLTYINEFTNVIPTVSSEDFFPSIPPPSLALGNVYRVGFLSPFNGVLAMQYKWRSGWRVNPIIGFNVGYPYGSGLITATQINGQAVNVPNTNVSIQPAIGGSPAATRYVDPANPGSIYAPNVAATRGTPENNSPGGTLTNSRVNLANLSVEYNKPGSRSTIGLLVSNLFNNVYGIPTLNGRYQPVATGISGPRTGTTSPAATFGEAFGYVNYPALRYGTSPYLETPSGNPTQYRLYYQITL